MPLHPSPCEPWPFDPCCEIPEDTPPTEVDRWMMVATTILWSLSGRRYGPSCPITIRPCGRSCIEELIPFTFGASSGSLTPYIDANGAWRNAVCGCTTDCACEELCELRLDGPVYDVIEVLVDGVTLPPETYRIDSANLLVRLDGFCWDACQNLAAPPTEPGTASVTYRTGLPLDAAAIAAHSELVCHLLKQCTGSSSCGCKANPNLTRVQRQGLTMEMADPTLIYSEGRTGLPLVDMWLTAVNPYRQWSPSRVYSPDYKRPRGTTWP